MDTSRGRGLHTSLTDRVVVSCKGKQPGPLLLCLAGIHGDEPAGITAAKRVAAELDDSICGSFVALAGNLSALRATRRYIDVDLNRLWTDDRIAELRSPIGNTDSRIEAQEQNELLNCLDSYLNKASRDIFFIDLHSTSSESIPFAVTIGNSNQRGLTKCFPVPVIRVVHGKIPGSIIDFMARQGSAAITFEGGAHAAPVTIAAHEAALWLALEHAGIVKNSHFQKTTQHEEFLRTQARSIDGVYEVFYKHDLTADDNFSMLPDIRNFEVVHKGDLLAYDKRGEVRALDDGYVFLPTYRFPSDYGFFLIRPLDPLPS